MHDDQKGRTHLVGVGPGVLKAVDLGEVLLDESHAIVGTQPGHLGKIDGELFRSHLVHDQHGQEKVLARPQGAAVDAQFEEGFDPARANVNRS